MDQPVHDFVLARRLDSGESKIVEQIFGFDVGDVKPRTYGRVRNGLCDVALAGADLPTRIALLPSAINVSVFSSKQVRFGICGLYVQSNPTEEACPGSPDRCKHCRASSNFFGWQLRFAEMALDTPSIAFGDLVRRRGTCCLHSPLYQARKHRLKAGEYPVFIIQGVQTKTQPRVAYVRSARTPVSTASSARVSGDHWSSRSRRQLTRCWTGA